MEYSQGAVPIYNERDQRHRMDLRIEAVEVFFEFASVGLGRLTTLAQQHGLGMPWLINPLERVRTDFKRNLDAVVQSAQRNVGPSANRV